MRNLYGIVHTEDGRYVMAAMRFNDSGSWVASGIRQWQSNNVIMPYLLFRRGISFGVNAWWRPRTSAIAIDNMVTAESAAAEETDQKYDLVTYSADLRIHTQVLKSNLIAVAPQDLFLATLPLNLHEKSTDSFLSICSGKDYYLIGVTVNQRLVISYKMAPCSEEKLPGYIGRIRRYWNINFPEIVFPETVFIIGDSSAIPDSAFVKHPVRVAEGEDDINALRAMGVAFARDSDSVPLFASQTEESAFRKKRTLLYGVSAGLVAITLLILVFFIGINLWYGRRIDSFKAEYRRVISHNQDVKKIIDRNKELAETILRLENTFTHKTIWGKFLHVIASGKPDNLYFERLASEPVKEKGNVINIALNGWTENESSVTEFISTLQELPYVTQITLSSMERDKKKPSVYLFKILCTLLLNEQ